MNTKMTDSAVESKGNKIIRDDADAIEFKRFYKSTLIEKGVRQEEEGHSLWKSQAQVAKYLSDYSGTHLSVYEVPRSIIANDIMGYIANQMGGHFTPKVGEGLNGSIKDEISAVLKSVSVIIACEHDPAKCKAELKRIVRNAESALEELS